MKTSAAPLSITLAAGCNQLIIWGISFYMPVIFARAIVRDTCRGTMSIVNDGIDIAMGRKTSSSFWW